MADELVPADASQALALADARHELALASLDDSKRKARWPGQSVPKRGKRWGLAEDKPFKPLPYVDLPVGLSEKEVDQFLREQRLEDLHRKIQLHQLEDVEPDIRPPSPPPLYDRAGNRLNTREIRIRKAMNAEYSRLVRYMIKTVEGYVPPPDYRPQRLVKKIIIPYERFPQAPFMGVIIGARGVNHKRLQETTGCRIFIRGRDIGDKWQTDEELQMLQHVHIEADTEEQIEAAEKVIMPLLNPESPEFEYARTHGMQQLAVVNGFTLKRAEQRCGVCGAVGHLGFECPETGGQNYRMANVCCTICGDKGHVAADCKLAAEKRQRENADWKAEAERKQGMEAEYSRMMSELGIAPSKAAAPPQPKPEPRVRALAPAAPTRPALPAPASWTPRPGLGFRPGAASSVVERPLITAPRTPAVAPPRAGAPQRPPAQLARRPQVPAPRVRPAPRFPAEPPPLRPVVFVPESAASAEAPAPTAAPEPEVIECDGDIVDESLLCPPELHTSLHSWTLDEMQQETGARVALGEATMDGERRFRVQGSEAACELAKLHLQAWMDVKRWSVTSVEPPPLPPLLEGFPPEGFPGALPEGFPPEGFALEGFPPEGFPPGLSLPEGFPPGMVPPLEGPGFSVPQPQPAVLPLQPVVLPPPQPAVLPPQPAMLPSQTAVLPLQAAVLPPQAAVLPHQAAVLPLQAAVLPPQAMAVLPPQTVVLPPQTAGGLALGVCPPGMSLEAFDEL